MQFQITSVLMALGLVASVQAVGTYCYKTQDLCNNSANVCAAGLCVKDTSKTNGLIWCCTR